MHKTFFTFAMLATMCVTGCREGSTPSAPTRDSRESELRHKLECQKLRQAIEDSLEKDQFILESLYSVFYSSKQNSCLAAKYTLYPHKDKPEGEKLEIDDLLDQREVWSLYLTESRTYPEVDEILDKQIDQLK